MTAKCSTCHSGFFSVFPGRAMNVTKVIRSPESISHNFANMLLFWCVFFFTVFLMTQYISAIKGGAEEDSRGERRDVCLHPPTHPPTHTQTHAHTHKYTQRHTLCVVCCSTCAFEKRQSSSLFSFGSHEVTRHCFSSLVNFNGCHRKDGPLEVPYERPLDAELVITLLWKAFYWCDVLQTS